MYKVVPDLSLGTGPSAVCICYTVEHTNRNKGRDLTKMLPGLVTYRAVSRGIIEHGVIDIQK